MTRTLPTPNLAAVAVMASRITHLYREATPEEVRAGTEWYATAHALAAELLPGDVSRAAAIIAVLSPRQAWGRNAALARQAVETGDGASLPVMHDQRRKVMRLLHGEDPDAVVSGPKVRSFWQTIADPLGTHDAVIDRHALAVARGERLAGDALRITPTEYRETVMAYALAADALGHSPHAVQAVTWLRWRNVHAHPIARAAG
jgi:hypothetical protein